MVLKCSRHIRKLNKLTILQKFNFSVSKHNLPMYNKSNKLISKHKKPNSRVNSIFCTQTCKFLSFAA